MKKKPADPKRWTTGAPDSPIEQRMGAALLVAATETLAERRPTTRAPSAIPSLPRRGWALPAMAAVVMLSLGVGTVAAAQAVRLVRRAREAAWSTVNVPAGNTVSISRRAGLRIHVRGPMSIEADGERIALSGTGEASVESGSRPIEIVTDAGVAVHLAAGVMWSPPAPSLPPQRPPASAMGLEPPRVAATAAPTLPPPEPTGGVSSARRVVAPPSREDQPAAAPTSAPIEPPPAIWAAAPPTETRDGEGGEAALVAAAFRALRTEHDPTTALSLLERHAKSFPSGALLGEAGMARVEALLALGLSGQALAALEALPASVAMTPPRLLLRGELRAANGRCASARIDFAAVEATGSGELATRARAAAASCAEAGANGTSRREPTEEKVEGTLR